MKADTVIVLILIFIALWLVFVGVLIGQASTPQLTANLFTTISTLITPFATLAAALSGSWYAFKLHDEKSRKENDTSDVEAANIAIYELTRWYNKLLNYKEQFLLEHQSNTWRQYRILPVAGMTFGNPNVDYNSLSFILKSKKPNILGEFAIVEQNIASALDIIKQRSQLHVETLQPAIEELEKLHGPSFAPHLIDIQLGPRNAQVIKMCNYSAAIIKAGIFLSNNNLSAWLDETPCLRQVEI